MLLLRKPQIQDLAERLLKEDQQSLIVSVGSLPGPPVPFVVRPSQMQELEAGQYLAFENETLVWLEEEFPDTCAMLGENAAREKIRSSVQIAGRYGFHCQADAQRFIFLAFMLGPNFELMPGREWIKAILERRGGDPDARMDEVYEELALRLEHLEEPSSI